MQDPLQHASRQIQRAFAADGLTEIAAGLLFLLPAILEWTKSALSPHDTVWRVLNLTQILVLFPGVWAVTRFLPPFRNRILGGRAGIVIPRRRPANTSKAWAAAIVAVMTAAVLAVMRSGRHWVALTVLVTGIASALILIRIGQESGIARFFYLAAAILLISLAVAFQAADFETSFQRQFAAIGTLLILSGLVTLARFLGTHPRSPEAVS